MIVTAVTLIIVKAVENYNFRLGEILGTQMVWPFVSIFIVALFHIVFVISKKFLTDSQKGKKKNRAFKK